MTDENPFAGIFSPTETQMGQDAYQASVDHTKAVTEAIKKRADAFSEMHGTIRMVVSFLLLMSLPLYAALVVHVWKAVL